MYNLLSIDLDWLQSGYHLKELNKLFFDKVKYTKKIIFGNHHHIILEDLKQIKNINLYNIDHHHDIVYKDWQVNDIKINRSSHGCWIGNLLEQNRVKKYHWFKNFNSVPVQESYYSEELLLRNSVEFFTFENLYELEFINFDHIFVCKSAEYTYKEFVGTYDVYLDFCKSFFDNITFERKLKIDVPNARMNI